MNSNTTETLQDQYGDTASTARRTALLARLRELATQLRKEPTLRASVPLAHLEEWCMELERAHRIEEERWSALAEASSLEAEIAARPVIRELPRDLASAADVLYLGRGPHAVFVVDGWRVRPGAVIPHDHPARAAIEAYVAAAAARSGSSEYGEWLLPSPGRLGLAGAQQACPLMSAFEIASVVGPRLAWKWGQMADDLRDRAGRRALDNAVGLAEANGVTPAMLAAWWQAQEATR